MPRAKRPLEDADPNVESSPNKSSKGNDSRRRSLRSSGRVAEKENATPAKAKSTVPKTKDTNSKSTGKGNPQSTKKRGSNSKTTATKATKAKDPKTDNGNTQKTQRTTAENAAGAKGEKKQSKGKAKDTEEDTPDKLPPFDYVTTYPPYWDWTDQHRGKDEEKARVAYNKKLKEWKSLMYKPIEQYPKHEWILMRGALVRSIDAIYDSNKRNPDLLGMYIYNDFQGYGLHEIVENFIVDYRKEYMQKDEKRDLKAMWVIISGLIHYLKNHDAIDFLFGHIDDGERVVGVLRLIGTTILSMLDLLEESEQLKTDSDFKDLALVMKLYIIWAEEWDAMTYEHATQEWDAKILKYAQDHGINLSTSPPHLAASTVRTIEPRARKQKAWPKPGPDRWGFKKAFNKHNIEYGSGGTGIGLGGDNFDITKMTKAERIRYSFDKKDPFAGVPAKAFRDGTLVIDTLG